MSSRRSGQDRPERDRHEHPWRSHLGDGRAVAELDHRVNPLLRVHDDVDGREGHVEEQVRLDDLQALVDQGRRVRGDDLAHRIVRVRERLLGRHLAQLLARPAAERSRHWR
jgi:hypothetical protein